MKATSEGGTHPESQLVCIMGVGARRGHEAVAHKEIPAALLAIRCHHLLAFWEVSVRPQADAGALQGRHRILASLPPLLRLWTTPCIEY
jgi:hypothetical protein